MDADASTAEKAGSRWARIRALLPSLQPPLLVLIPLIALELLYAAVVQFRVGHDLSHPLPWLFLLQKLIRDSTLLLLILCACSRFSRKLWPRITFTSLYLFLLALDTALFYYGTSVFDRYYLDLIAWYSIREFLTLPVLLLILLGAGLCTGAAFLHHRYKEGLTAGFTARWGVALGLLAVINPPSFAEELFPTYDDAIVQQLHHSAQNPLVNFVDELLFERRPDPVFAESAEPYREEIERFGLGLGPAPDPPPLKLKPFRKIVLFSTESLPLHLIAAHNPDLEVELTPFYSSPSLRRQTFTNYWSSCMLTTRGIWASLYSHPNSELVDTGAIRPSLAHLLQEQGFETVFIRSASKYYGPDLVSLRRAGFDRVIGGQDFERDPDLRPYVKRWGLYDRLLYKEVERMLTEGPERIFIQVLGVDTHVPFGREDDYADLVYPPPPDGLERFGTEAPFLRSIFHHDRDLAAFVERLKTRGLWTDDVLLILTADHSPPYSTTERRIERGYGGTPLDRIPLIFLTPQNLPETDMAQLACQLDLAPTVAHLTGLPAPSNWWGTSLYDPDRRPHFVGTFNESLFFKTAEARLAVQLENPKSESEERLTELFRTVLRP